MKGPPGRIRPGGSLSLCQAPIEIVWPYRPSKGQDHGIPLVRAEHTPLIVPGGIKWRWTLYGLAIRGESVPGGFADSLEDAQAKSSSAPPGTWLGPLYSAHHYC
jgi:hypothetical protein